MKKTLSLLVFVGSPILLILIDVFIGGAPCFSVFAFLVVFLYMIPKTILSLIIARKRDKFKRNLTITLIYLATVILIWSAIWLDMTIAAQRGLELVEAVGKYQAKYKRYPEKLRDIAPEFAPRIPASRILKGGEFWYSPYKDSETGQESHTLTYLGYAPFSRHSYSFEKKTWVDYTD